jgi:hypothetical protein
MFGLFKSKELAEKEARVTEIGKMLFAQIASARNSVRGGLIDAKDFHKRINSMFTAGYLLGYVDEHFSEMFTDEKSKSKYAARIYEGIFPGAGVKLVQSKLGARRIGGSISTGSDKYIDVFIGCQQFDTGVSAGRLEAFEYLADGKYTPNKLERYLSTGQVE